MVLNFTPSYPASGDTQDERAARLFDGFFNRWFLEPLVRGAYPEDMWEVYGADVPEVHADDLERVSAPLDFLGVNYYSRASDGRTTPDGEPPRFKSIQIEGEHTDMGWEVFPQGLTDLLVRLSTDYPGLPPLLITENGAAYPDVLGDGEVKDEARIRYLKTHLGAVAEAVERGADVRGYFAWSLLDNFEWAFGYSKRFGLVYTDYETLERIPKASAKWYAETVTATRGGRRLGGKLPLWSARRALGALSSQHCLALNTTQFKASERKL